jgi:hypothetical protein
MPATLGKTWFPTSAIPQHKLTLVTETNQVQLERYNCFQQNQALRLDKVYFRHSLTSGFAARGFLFAILGKLTPG